MVRFGETYHASDSSEDERPPVAAKPAAQSEAQSQASASESKKNGNGENSITRRPPRPETRPTSPTTSRAAGYAVTFDDAAALEKAYGVNTQASTFATSALPSIRGNFNKGKWVRKHGSAEAGSGSHKKRGVQEIVDEQDNAVPNVCTHFVVPLVVIVMVIVSLVAVVWTSGGATDSVSTPRVAVVVMEGFRGVTFNKMLAGQYLPNIQRFIEERSGQYAKCTSTSDSRCAHAAAVEDESTGTVHYASGSSIASILTGVQPSAHRVTNDSYAAYAQFAKTSSTYPSLMSRVRSAGLKTLAVGAPHLFTSITAADGQCTQYGVLDFECGISSLSQCLLSSSCNVDARYPVIGQEPTSQVTTTAESLSRFTAQLEQIFGSLQESEASSSATGSTLDASKGQQVANKFDSSLVTFHFNAMARLAGNANQALYNYSDESMGYLAEAFLLDSQLGQLFAYLADRAATQKENWLVVGTSDHGGLGHSFGSNGDDDDAIPFFLFPLTSNKRGFIRTAELTNPTSLLDVVPTVLRWLNIAPYNSEVGSVELENASRIVLPGKVQGICSSGTTLNDCTDE